MSQHQPVFEQQHRRHLAFRPLAPRTQEYPLSPGVKNIAIGRVKDLELINAKPSEQ